MASRAFVWNLPSGRVDVTENVLCMRVTIDAIGPLAALAEHAERLQSDYHPDGYGTYVHKPVPVGTGEGLWRLTASRSTRCS